MSECARKTYKTQLWFGFIELDPSPNILVKIFIITISLNRAQHLPLPLERQIAQSVKRWTDLQEIRGLNPAHLVVIRDLILIAYPSPAGGLLVCRCRDYEMLQVIAFWTENK